MAALGLVGDGFLDVAVGAPREDVGAKADAGAVEVLLGFLEGSGDLGSGSFTLTQGTGAEPGDLFGAAIATGDFNNDGLSTWRSARRGRTWVASLTPARSTCSSPPPTGP